jgi:predicted  nucleic acid-binding Zn-ribbon protein
MADKKPMGQTYYEEVEALKTQGSSNADAIREVAKKYGKNENAIRGGIHQYKSRHLNGSAPAARRGRRASSVSVEDYVANARKALEDALALIDSEVSNAKAALGAAQARYEEAQASVKDRKADIEKKLAALS